MALANFPLELKVDFSPLLAIEFEVGGGELTSLALPNRGFSFCPGRRFVRVVKWGGASTMSHRWIRWKCDAVFHFEREDGGGVEAFGVTGGKCMSRL